VDHRQTDVRQVTHFAASGDDAARFLRELRQLRDGAGLGQAELAARAHYPYDSIRAAEVGPALPELPVLAAYVKGCGGTTEEWEERWRSLTRSPSLPLQTTRSAGNSPAATAGARIGSAAQDGEIPDPSVIIAALNRVADDMASSSDTLPEPDVAPSWTALDAETPLTPARAGEAETRGDERSAGWDPIRVSTAWPVLPPSADGTEPAGEAGAVSGTPWESAPWDSAPWAEDPGATSWAEEFAGGEADLGAGRRSAAEEPSAGAPHPVSPVAPASPVTAAVPSGAARAAASAWAPAQTAARNDAAGQAGGSSRTRVLVLSAVLLCVIAVVLAVFV
jgi:Helix-turn-helix domain